MKPTAKPGSSTVFTCWKFLVLFYLMLFCILGIAVGLFASFLLIFRQESHALAPKIVLYFIIVPPLFTITSTIVGWTSVRRKNITLLKLFAVLLGITVITEIVGSLWCFASLHNIQNEILLVVSEKFSKISSNYNSKTYWDNIQKKYQCCGFHGPTDYKLREGIPFSCCGSNDQETNQASCILVWQKGCSDVLSSKILQDLILTGLTGIGISFLQIPGIFISWCFSNRISRESL